MKLPSLATLEQAAQLVYAAMPPTPQIPWPQLSWRCGCEVWVKHDNHTAAGAFKIRGGIVYFERLRREYPEVRGVIAATRGNHGQSIAFAARRHGLSATIVVPHGNSPEKNAAMRARGAELIEAGSDFQAALEYAQGLAAQRDLHMVPSFDAALVHGVATGALELFRGAPKLATLYVPIGMGSGACAAIAAREALGLSTEVVGVVATAAPAYAESFAARRVVSAPVGPTVADGMACRTPDAAALDIMLRGVARIVTVNDEEIRFAMRTLFTDTHNVAEGAGAAALAALLQERSRAGRGPSAVMLTGGNVDSSVFAEVLGAAEPAAALG